MVNVGFPEGLSISMEEIRQRLSVQPDSDLDRLLVAVERDSGDPVGECMLHLPDGSGIARTDIKLLPGSWGRGYGTELKRGLLAYLFSKTECSSVEATPNRKNLRSIRMQEAVGGERVGEGTFTFPPGGREATNPVHYLVYRVTRNAWEKEDRTDSPPPSSDAPSIFLH